MRRVFGGDLKPIEAPETHRSSFTFMLKQNREHEFAPVRPEREWPRVIIIIIILFITQLHRGVTHDTLHFKNIYK